MACWTSATSCFQSKMQIAVNETVITAKTHTIFSAMNFFRSLKSTGLPFAPLRIAALR